jgi:hypothetical protein
MEGQNIVYLNRIDRQNFATNAEQSIMPAISRNNSLFLAEFRA